MQCDVCNKKKATVHLTEIVDSQMTEMHLCEECAREKSVQMEQQFGLADLLAGLTDFNKNVKEPPQPAYQCKSCGMTFDNFKKLGRLGCGECYASFDKHLGVLLKKIHGSNRHNGKAPGTLPPETEQEKESGSNLESLKADLVHAIENEDFERAARLRDQIRELGQEEQE